MRIFSRSHLPAFSKESIQLILFRESDAKGRHLILDSRCIKKVRPEDVLCEVNMAAATQLTHSPLHVWDSRITQW